MGFRFRRSIKIAPGVRINLGKTGASISAGVPGARVTFGKHGTRTTVGVPGTGASYTTYTPHAKTTEPTPNMDAPIQTRHHPSIPLLIGIVVLPLLARVWDIDSDQFHAGASITAIAAVAAALYLRALNHRGSDPGAGVPSFASEAEPSISTEQHPSSDEVMRLAAEQKRKRDAQQLFVQEQEERLALALTRYRCFYQHDGETLGPVTLWQVREMIEADLFDPDVQVILEGSDSWMTYAEQELRIAPPSGNIRALQAAAKLQCHYSHVGQLHGPVSLLVILHKIRLGELPVDVQVRAQGTEQWKRSCDVVN